jgi:type III pantothenate kinase
MNLLLFDNGNTHTHLGLANTHRVFRQENIATSAWFDGQAPALVRRFVGKRRLSGVALGSVVPRATSKIINAVKRSWGIEPLVLSATTLQGVGVRYPRPESIGADRLANAVAVRHYHGAPAVVVAFGTAVAFDIVDKRGDYVGGIIAPGLAAMTDYLHEKTALLPRIRIREVRGVVGKSTEQAMLIGAVHGYRGLIRGLLQELKRELNCRKLPVVATGGYAKLMASRLPEITSVEPLLTLEGLRLVWLRRECVI